jgi:hypothetical protein
MAAVLEVPPDKQNPFGMRRIVRIPEGADFLEINVSTMKNLIRSGKVRSVKIGGSRRVLVDSLLEIAERGTE